MLRLVLRLTTVFIVLQSLLLSSLAMSQIQEKPTPFEAQQMRQISDLFMKRLAETGDLSCVIDELYVEDFIWRYLREQQRNSEEANSSAVGFFAPGLNYKKDLLTQATEQDWRRLYVATYNFYYHVVILGLNLHADDLLDDNTPEEEALEKLLPPAVLSLLDAHPILKNLFEPKGDPKAIETLEEMQDVSATLEKGLRLLLTGQTNFTVQLNKKSKQVIEKLMQTELPKPRTEVSDKESFGYPAGTRMLWTMTPIFFGLTLVKVNGKLEILWAEFAIEI